MGLFKKKKKNPIEPELQDKPKYEPGFLSVEDLTQRDALKVNLHTFEKTNFRVMCFTNNEGDSVELGKLIGFQVYACGNAHPVVLVDSDGLESVWMGFVLPLWEELLEFLKQQGGSDRFWKMVDMMHGWNGLHRFDQIVRKDMKGY